MTHHLEDREDCGRAIDHVNVRKVLTGDGEVYCHTCWRVHEVNARADALQLQGHERALFVVRDWARGA